MYPATRLPGRLVLLILAACAALLAGADEAAAINVCGDGICQSTGFPPETPQNCQADCGFCGDGICGYPETCSTCLNDCAGSCLSFTLSSELKKSGCANDDDGDCLDNGQETSLAWIASPWYYYDEDEGCAGAWYTQSPDALHYDRQDFVQIRPQGSNVHLWSSSSSPKTVQVTYFFLHPHDCRSHAGFAGHQGDSEHVRFKFKSLDLRKWTLVSSEFYNHGRVHSFSGSYLKARASEIGTVYPNVGADEDSHGSWPGRVGSSSDCAGSEDDFCFGTCDCFKGSMQSALSNGYREVPSGSFNVGGPAPEQWRSSVVTVSGGDAYSVLDVGHGANREYWTPRSDGYKKFCGWECTLRWSSGDCYWTVHSESSCASPLSEKVDTSFFTNGLAAQQAPSFSEKNAAVLALEPAREQRLREEIRHLVSYAPVSGTDLEWWQSWVAEADDPVGALVPMVSGRPVAQQIEILRWVATVPEKKYSALAPGLLDPRRDAPELLEASASDLLEGLSRALEEHADAVR